MSKRRPDNPEGDRITLFVNGITYSVPEGITVAVALQLTRHQGSGPAHRTSRRASVFCGMGSCYECVATIDGISGIRTCITPLRAGMRVETEGMLRSA